MPDNRAVVITPGRAEVYRQSSASIVAPDLGDGLRTPPMDISTTFNNYKPDTPFVIELRFADGSHLLNNDGSPMTISVLGADSERGVKSRHAQTDARLRMGTRAKLTAASLEADAASYLADLTTAWDLTDGTGGKPPYSRAAAIALYTNPRMAFIREQVDAAIGERANFFIESPPEAAPAPATPSTAAAPLQVEAGAQFAS